MYFRKKFGRYLFTNLFINFFQNKKLEESAYSLFKKEFNSIENYLPEEANNVLDIGCGLGLLNIFINQKYNNKPEFFLLDKNKVVKKVRYGFEKNYEGYNFLDETKNILFNNGINYDKIHIHDVDKEVIIKKTIDIVISLKSLAFHYPFENYIKLFSKCCDQKTIFIFDITPGKYNLDYFKKYFTTVEVIYEEKTKSLLQRLHCNGFKLF